MDDCYIPMPKGFAFKAVHPDTGELCEYRHLVKSSKGRNWELGMCRELGRLFQGYKETKGTDTCRFIKKSDVPKDRNATYVRVVVADRPRKAEEERVRVTVGGDKVDYPGEVSTKTSELVTAKVLLNSVISDPDALFMCADVKDFYLNTNLPRKEYIKIPINIIPQEIIDLYNLMDLVVDGYVYVEVSKGMYGLPQAGRVASDELLPRLKAAGYTPTGRVPGLFRHKSNSIVFCLTVDDFGIKFKSRLHARHLLDTLKKHYKITEDWEGNHYCGLDLDWNYKEGYVDVSMKGYVQKALQRFEHETPRRKQNAPSKYSYPNYGAKVQLAEDDDVTAPLDKREIKKLQEIIGTFLYYARAVD